jgi:hypothetical protein
MNLFLFVLLTNLFTCHRYINSSKPQIPKLSIAAGIDFGHPDRLGFPQLTLSEELLICRSRQYVSILILI